MANTEKTWVSDVAMPAAGMPIKCIIIAYCKQNCFASHIYATCNVLQNLVATVASSPP